MPDVRLDWIQSPDDPTLAGDVVSYELARDTGPNPLAIVATIPAGVAGDDTVYAEALAPGTYWWRVRAVNAAGRRSPWSDEVSETLVSDVAVLPEPGRIHTVEARRRTSPVQGRVRVTHVIKRRRIATP